MKVARARISSMRSVGLFTIFTFSFFALPVLFVNAQNFVPCEGVECNLCHIVMMVSRVLNWAGMILGYVAAIALMWAGIKFVTSLGNPTQKDAAKKLFFNVLIGYTIVLLAWVLIDTGMRIFTDQENFGPWNNIECREQPRGGGPIST